MKFKPINDDSYKDWAGKPIVCVEDGWTKTIKGKTYICLKEYADGSCQTRAKDGQTYTSNKTLFRLA
ncbi:MAG: hypothetical protein ACRCX2_07860, partial [Paraclostridium sp.]